MVYEGEDCLNLSGIRHFTFCRRQWALIHIEHQWCETLNIAEKESSREIFSGGVFVKRNFPVISREIGLSGICDFVEFIADNGGISVDGKSDKYRICPVKYTPGAPVPCDADLLELTAQAMCLEEMFCCPVREGFLCYDGMQRKQVIFTGALRERVRRTAAEMHLLFFRGETPMGKPAGRCNTCRLQVLCLPSLLRGWAVISYLNRRLTEQQLVP